ncbi:MAG: sugar ABC transporter substrate-binding protein, partial [Firmicutes bacterium]|nr:sugar ABC transporter substrate-binding protein [Bacillota bacterium]
MGRKTLAFSVAVLSLALVFGASIALAKTQVTFLNFFNAPELWEPFFKEAFEQFEAAHPDIEVKQIFTPYGEIRQKLLTMVAGGTPPDIVSVPSDVAADYISRGLLLPLNSYIESSAEAQATFEDFYPSRMRNYQSKGSFYAVPIDIGPNGVYYNMDLFDAAGVTYPEKDWTMDDLIEKARKLKNFAEWPFDFSRDLHRLYPIYAAFGGEPFYNEDLTEFQMASEKSIRALEQLAALVEEGLAPTMAQQTAATQGSGGFLPFSAGKYAMSYEWIGQISYLHKPGVPVKRWDTCPLPKGENPVQISGGQGFAIVKGSKNPDAAWKVIEWFMSEPMQKAMAERGVWFPARISMGEYAIPADGRPSRFVETFIDTMAEYGYAPFWYVPG